MQWQQVVMLGATGGLVVEVITLWGHLTSWQRARHIARVGRKRVLPSLSQYIDPQADTLVAVTRLLLGAAAGVLMHDQIDGPMAAIAVGAAGPALLRHLGSGRTVHDALARGESPARPAADAPVVPPARQRQKQGAVE
ncbi:hypothetical protein [Nonomuraea sp. NPDC046570]|uniref:hypothetical protein n=1 Tax=Nonomuraea sp. NPDC046570 TaxID=3155255 RepID=UPI0033D84654